MWKKIQGALFSSPQEPDPPLPVGVQPIIRRLGGRRRMYTILNTQGDPAMPRNDIGFVGWMGGDGVLQWVATDLRRSEGLSETMRVPAANDWGRFRCPDALSRLHRSRALAVWITQDATEGELLSFFDLIGAQGVNVLLFGYAHHVIPMLTPGPLPWYLNLDDPWRPTHQEGWCWKVERERDTAGLSRLQDRDGRDRLVLDMYTWLRPQEDGRVLLWYRFGAEAGSQRFRMLLLDPRELEVLPPDRFELEKLKRPLPEPVFRGPAPPSFEFPAHLPEGTHEIEVPAAFRELPALLILGAFQAYSTEETEKGSGAAIFDLDLRKGRVEILPRGWIAEQGGDGHAWITGVDRDPATGRILVEGARLGQFWLDPSGRRLEKRVFEDSLHRPGLYPPLPRPVGPSGETG
ncbi:MAG: hypothetical protein ACE5H3_10510 [Planctomycetota bacterium]